jgi:hypothetical protein
MYVSNNRESWLNSSDLYSGCHWFESWPEHRKSRLRFLVVFLSPSRQIPGYCLKLSRTHPFPHPPKFIIYQETLRKTMITGVSVETKTKHLRNYGMKLYCLSWLAQLMNTWDVTSCNLLHVHQCSVGMFCLNFQAIRVRNSEDGSSKFSETFTPV